MTDNAPANWYAQPDGSQRYWDGSQWTDHIVPAASPTSSAEPNAGVAASPPPTPGEPDARPWWKKKRFVIPGAALVAFLGIGALGAAASGGNGEAVASPSPSPVVANSSADPSESAVPTTFVMPEVVGSNLQDAQDSLQALGSYLVDQEDASGEGRLQLVDSNWTVCTQEPAAGAEVPVEARVLLAAVKDDEPCPGDEPDESNQAKEPTEPQETDEPADDAPQETVAQENARESAVSYLDFSAFSRAGLIGQLEYEGFASADAEYAVDAVGADWKEQAAKSAESYLDFSAFSYTGLIEQLEYEGFTSDQATHGADAVDADWNEQAVKSAESYLDFSSFSRASLIDQLKYEGFTTAQATHAVDEVGL
ncbi:Ltp family lipoprotein [Demequina muriae]|uniref:Ltp family lipoprotein n=1 Tax=Demequina muriae TaxID=3051664 RepID=A0ABT8GE39_9MICO|nr:Ltp family lipoprotein [Demequina sp. EGI L300058]MDN4479685.1 Ltp family lipoprotein [Demequina sp. EGI L300058]